MSHNNEIRLTNRRWVILDDEDCIIDDFNNLPTAEKFMIYYQNIYIGMKLKIVDRFKTTIQIKPKKEQKPDEDDYLFDKMLNNEN